MGAGRAGGPRNRMGRLTTALSRRENVVTLWEESVVRRGSLGAQLMRGVMRASWCCLRRLNGLVLGGDRPAELVVHVQCEGLGCAHQSPWCFGSRERV